MFVSNLLVYDYYISLLHKSDFFDKNLSMLENDQRYLVEISPIKLRSEEVFILTSENVTP